MELCKKTQVEFEYDIDVLVGSTNFYNHLQFFLLASTWFPRPLGVCLWSLLHAFLVLYEALVLLALLPIVFALAVCFDVYMATVFITAILFFPFAIIFYFGIQGIVIAVAWLWLVITCQCCTMPGRAPGQGLGHYIRTAGGTLDLQEPQPAPAGQGGAVTAGAGPCAILRDLCQCTFTVTFVKHVVQVSFPYRRVQLVNLCREIVPLYDTIVI